MPLNTLLYRRQHGRALKKDRSRRRARCMDGSAFACGFCVREPECEGESRLAGIPKLYSTQNAVTSLRDFHMRHSTARCRITEKTRRAVRR